MIRNTQPAQQDVALAACGAVFGRYLFACPLSTAQRLLAFMESGRLQVVRGAPSIHPRDNSWRLDWPDGRYENFDAVLCATGFHKRRPQVVGDSLHLPRDEASLGASPRVSADLRVHFGDDRPAERIWLVGLASHPAAPIVNAVYQAVRQADAICADWRRTDLSAAGCGQRDLAQGGA